ncbi:MFS transporter [Bradyrhizobium sp. CB3481]|uniref:MFS transporter n=1 Tax=Bradyrhizobium sp. CB3481 TaxID=3039158 RepID=UPI0024B20189|nr:MFS transporter [Bradyrhizobium sp. CB3481]WFU14457.1 MFS transporter [Bradyrhizobium sp. CB3481]
MKPCIGVYLSEPVAARLAVAAQRPGATKSAIIEAALTHFLDADHDIKELSIDRRLSAIHENLEQLHQDVRIVSETVALQARFLLAVTPAFTTADQPNACALGLARFDEFAAQVARRVHLGTSLIKETIERVNSTDREHVATESVRQEAPTRSTHPELKGAARTAAGNKRQTPRFAGAAPCEQEPALRAEQTSPGATSRSLLPVRRATARQRPLGLFQDCLLILRVFLPFVAAYCLSLLFRNINATIAGPLTHEFGLGADDLGLLTSIYFLTFAAAQIPIGILLDRYGPRQIQSAVLLAAAAGATLFAISDNFLLLLLGRALIGLGASGALMAGLKAVVLWFPAKQGPLLNGLMVMLAALGGATATLPAEYLLVSVGWRGLFELLAIASVGCALAIFLVVPKATRSLKAKETTIGLRMIYTDPRFWRLAPLSATCIGTAWALHGLWAAQWFSDVEGLDRSTLLRNLFAMALASSAGALVLGVAAQKLRRYGIGPRPLLKFVAILFFVAQLAVILRVPLPSSAPWMIVAAVGAGTVLSSAILADFFPKELSGRANAALNVLHISCAFVVQSLIGFVVQHWTPLYGHYPEVAYQTAFAVNLAVQLGAWFWFIIGVPLSGATKHLR